jgi:hypothetical protein
MKRISLLILIFILGACQCVPQPVAPATATSQPRESLDLQTPSSKPAGDNFKYIGYLHLGKAFVYDGEVFIFVMSLDGKMILSQRSLNGGLNNANEITGAFGYNDIQFWPNGIGVDVWSKNNATGFIDPTVESPTCVGVYDKTSYALLVRNSFGIAVDKYYMEAVCRPNGKIEVTRQDIPEICYQFTTTEIWYAQTDRSGFCKNGNNIITTWEYPKQTLMFP